MKLRIGNEALGAYKRLDYTPWHAIAEFIDNSTAAYINNKAKLDKLFEKKKEKLEIRVVYDPREVKLRISDNSFGMDEEDLDRALTVGRPPKNADGRSRYGMGLKTAACWFGDKWVIRTKKFGEEVEHVVDIDVQKLITGAEDVKHQRIKGKQKDLHYTLIEISNLERELKGRTLGKIKDFLTSMYREDLRQGELSLYWQDQPLQWVDIDENIYRGVDGNLWKKPFEFKVHGKRVQGWVGILLRGSRADAGFSIFQCNRMIKGWPDSWRPTSLYGQDQGSNDLINQRLVGEIHLDGFLVTHTKDNILWMGDEEDLVNEGLKRECSEYREKARTIRKRKDAEASDERGPSEKAVALAMEDFKAEITSSEMIDALRLESVPPLKAIEAFKEKLTNEIEARVPVFEAKIDEVNVRVYLESLSPNDWYVTSEAAEHDRVTVIVNKEHPHWTELPDEQAVLNYIRHCVYDALAEWKARHVASRLDPDTIKTIKDGFLRVPLEIAQHLQDEGSD